METSMIKRVCFLLLLLSVQLFSQQYDMNIVYIEAKLFPKIALLEKQIQKSDAPDLNIYIFAKDIDLDVAQSFKSKIEANYPNILLNKKIIVRIMNFTQDIKHKPAAIIVLQHSKKELQKIAMWANKNKIITFAYDPIDLNVGLLVSIYIGKTIQPYLNKQIIKQYGFIFNPYLMQLSKFKE